MANALLHGSTFTPCFVGRTAPRARAVSRSLRSRAVVRAAAQSSEDLGFKTMRKGVKEVRLITFIL